MLPRRSYVLLTLFVATLSACGANHSASIAPPSSVESAVTITEPTPEPARVSGLSDSEAIPACAAAHAVWEDLNTAATDAPSFKNAVAKTNEDLRIAEAVVPPAVRSSVVSLQGVFTQLEEKARKLDFDPTAINNDPAVLKLFSDLQPMYAPILAFVDSSCPKAAGS